MRRRRVGCLSLILAGAGALVAVLVTALPERALRLVPGPADRRVVHGALHVHTRRSDGSGTVADVARAAHAAGLDFVIFTDHGDGTRRPDPPAYLEDVLCIDAVEISTTGGHYLALGLGEAPYRLAGEPRDVVEDVARLGGFGIVAHPDSPKPELRWTEWDAGIGGLEWLNGDSAWRDEPALSLARAFGTYWLRAPETIASFFSRDAHALGEWDRIARDHPVVAVAGQDAHARVSLNGSWEPSDTDTVLRLPGYKGSFRAFALRARLPTPFTRRADHDAEMILDAIRGGRVFTVIDALAGPADLQFTARWDGQPVAEMGGTVSESGPVVLQAAVTPAPGARLVLLRDGAVVARSASPVLQFDHPGGLGRAVYRVEAFLDGRQPEGLPWIVGNPIYVGAPADRIRSRRLEVTEAEPLSMEPRKGDWIVERESRSDARLEREADEGLAFAWRLSDGARHGQYAAAARPLPRGRLHQWDQVALILSATGPMRVSVQLRSPSGDRWIRSAYVDTTPRDVTVRFNDLRPAEAATPRAPQLAEVDSLLVVVDTVNTPPGRSGVLHLRRARLERLLPEGQVRTVKRR
jgi:hypothetical protein